MLQATGVDKRSYKGCFQVRDEVTIEALWGFFLGWFQVSIKVLVLVAQSLGAHSFVTVEGSGFTAVFRASASDVGVSENWGTLFGGPCNKDPTILGYYIRVPYFRKLPCADRWVELEVEGGGNSKLPARISLGFKVDGL